VALLALADVAHLLCSRPQSHNATKASSANRRQASAPNTAANSLGALTAATGAGTGTGRGFFAASFGTKTGNTVNKVHGSTAGQREKAG
jgi:hypothetical protein